MGQTSMMFCSSRNKPMTNLYFFLLRLQTLSPKSPSIGDSSFTGKFLTTRAAEDTTGEISVLHYKRKTPRFEWMFVTNIATIVAELAKEDHSRPGNVGTHNPAQTSSATQIISAFKPAVRSQK